MTVGDGATRKDVAVFVAGGGNGFMTDIATWLVEAAAATGRTATLIEDRLPDDPNLANLVVAPHELYLLQRRRRARPSRRAAGSASRCARSSPEPRGSAAASR